MPRIDDYKQAIALSAEALSKEGFEEIVQRCGFRAVSTRKIRIPFLNRVYLLTYPEFTFSDEAESDKEVPLQEQVLLLHYLQARKPKMLAGKWISYREIPGASFYYSAFVKRAVEPLKQVFGHHVAGLLPPAKLLEGKSIEDGDAGFEFMLLPGVPLRLILWKGDEEFSPEANIVFDASIGELLSPEDCAWAASLLVYRLIGLSKR